MANLFFFRLLLGSSLVLALAGCGAEPAATQQSVAQAARPVPQGFQMCGGKKSEASALADIQQAVVLPFGTPMPAENSQVVVQFSLDYLGRVQHLEIAHGLGPAVDEAVLEAVRKYQPHFCPLDPDYIDHPWPGTVAFRLAIPMPGVATPTQRREADTRGTQTARRRPGEADSTFVRRVFPLSYDSTRRDLLTRAWRPNAFGKQLVFTLRSCITDYCGYSTLLLVLDPYQKNTYAVQQLVVPSQGDDTTLADLFLADVNHDGRQELLAIGVCCLRNTGGGCHDTYRTQIWQYLGPDRTGRPRYKEDETERPYLDDLATPAAVRRALAQHQRRRASRRWCRTPTAPGRCKLLSGKLRNSLHPLVNYFKPRSGIVYKEADVRISSRTTPAMPIRPATVSLLLLLGMAALLIGCTPTADSDSPAATAPPAPEPSAEWVPILEEPYNASGRAAVLAEVQRMLVLPFGTPVPAPGSRVVVRFELGGGMVKNQWIVRSLSRVADSAVLAAVHQLGFNNGPGYNEPPVRYTLVVPAPGAASAAQRREATTRYQRTAVRLPGEADTAFVRRVLPVSTSLLGEYDDQLQALAWRPSPYGRQLVFTQRVSDPEYRNGGYGWYNTDVFVLDPYAPRTYAVQQFHLSNMGDLNSQSVAPFVADVNHDGHPDLVTLITYSQSVSGGEEMPAGHFNYYRVQVWRTAGLDAAGRPRYREDETPYPYLEYRQDETPGPYPEEFSPATVRRLLARHWRQVARAHRQPALPHPATPADTTQKAGAASPSENGPGQ